MKNKQLLVALTIVLATFTLSCKKSEEIITSPATVNEIENVEAANAMITSLNQMTVYNDSLINHGGPMTHHYDSLYHHHDSLFLHHHQTYHHGDTIHHHPTGQHNPTHHNQHDSITTVHHSIVH